MCVYITVHNYHTQYSTEQFGLFPLQTITTALILSIYSLLEGGV